MTYKSLKKIVPDITKKKYNKLEMLMKGTTINFDIVFHECKKKIDSLRRLEKCVRKLAWEDCKFRIHLFVLFDRSMKNVRNKIIKELKKIKYTDKRLKKISFSEDQNPLEALEKLGIYKENK